MSGYHPFIQFEKSVQTSTSKIHQIDWPKENLERFKLCKHNLNFYFFFSLVFVKRACQLTLLILPYDTMSMRLLTKHHRFPTLIIIIIIIIDLSYKLSKQLQNCIKMNFSIDFSFVSENI